jgi:hypothetical protein
MQEQHKVDSVRMYLRLDVINKLKESTELTGSLTQRINEALLQYISTKERNYEEGNTTSN